MSVIVTDTGFVPTPDRSLTPLAEFGPETTELDLANTDDPVVLEKQKSAEQIAVASGMKYKIIPGSQAAHGDIAYFFNGAAFVQPDLQPS